MANMQHVETSIGQSDALALAAPIGDALAKFVARNDLLME